MYCHFGRVKRVFPQGSLPTAVLVFMTTVSVTLGAPAAADNRDAARAVRSVYEARTENVVLQKWDLSCGAAALATVLRYQHGESVTERDVALGLIDRPEYYENPNLIRARHGFSLLDMSRHLQRTGYNGVGFGQLRLDDLVERAPIIVPIELQGFPHFLVFRGATDSRVLLADPAFGNLTVDQAKFEDAWIDYGAIGKVGFMVTRDGNRAPPGELAPRPRDFVMFR